MLTGTHRFPRQDQVTYGRPAAEVVAELAKAWGCSRLLITTTASLVDGLAVEVRGALGDLCVGVFSGIGAHSPREGVIAAAAEARRVDADLLVALGGGSVIDATKVVQLCLWAGLTEVGQLDAYRAGRGEGRVDVAKVAPGVRMIAAPTTLSAAEFTAFAGVTDATRRALVEQWLDRKVSVLLLGQQIRRRFEWIVQRCDIRCSNSAPQCRATRRPSSRS